ncbi:MAG: hypothetical protein IMW96_06840 [Thermoanaerobacteraceae bacterium]|nr:hypothetical protein [Thermoanaerobacteraceae bacterium]
MRSNFTGGGGGAGTYGENFDGGVLKFSKEPLEPDQVMPGRGVWEFLFGERVKGGWQLFWQISAERR